MTSRSDYIPESEEKIKSPFELNPELTLYCPQENVEALEHPQVREFQDHIRSEYTPPEPVRDRTSILLMYPCTKTKPYLLSDEHLNINKHLLEQGWEPVNSPEIPEGLFDHLSEEYGEQLLETGPLTRDGVVVHRAVLSEPMGLVPYDLVYSFKGEPSPVSRYDDPGLFEHRGNTVCFWRDDATGEKKENGSWKWGPNERKAYAKIHNSLVEHLIAVFDRLDSYYEKLIGYVSPKMTHRSFLSSKDEKRQFGLPLAKQTNNGRVELHGVNDKRNKPIEIVPNDDEINSLLKHLKSRLEEEKGENLTDQQVKGYYGTAGGRATPLVLPETLSILNKHLSL